MSAVLPDEPSRAALLAPRPLSGGGRGAGHARTTTRLVLTGVVAVLTLTACGASDPTRTDAATVAPQPDTTATPPAAPAAVGAVPAVTVRPANEQPAAPSPPPVSLEIADLSIAMPVDPVGVEADGSMSLPETGERAGWYQYGPAPAGESGAVVVAAHVDTRATGLGEFAKLVDIQPGATIVVTDSTGSEFSYTVSTTERIAKVDVPLDQVFDRAGERRLVLVTCGGNFDRETGHYVDNVIVTALPTA
ncbi:class F sortase [Sanguibacter antarcticus]|uniref:Sortase family protein n=1 Tax=Sanguibacter antarcticus TaxID=372484 RepID=A0A2A9E7S8_9MICO|nr:class F sortase [Sanguibacter antarcticus]PFG35008.1 sortase family protein [Sanguibacter antarcticus]